MMMRSGLTACIVTAVVVAFSTGGSVEAGEGRCTCCQQSCGCNKVCRLVCEEKQVEVICWGCQCEDFCVPGPSKKLGTHCKSVCDECGTDGAAVDCSKPQSAPKRHVWAEWCPSFAKIFTRKKLMKRVEKVKVPHYKWVLEELCPQCEAACEITSVDARAQLPAPPAGSAKLIYAVKQ